MSQLKKQFFFEKMKEAGLNPFEARQYLEFLDRCSYESLKSKWVKINKE